MTWLVLCACSRPAQDEAADAGGDAGDAPSAPHPQPLLSLTPSASTGPSTAPYAVSSDPVDPSNPWERCRTGYLPLGDPSRDVLQLGLMCGASTGMRSLAQAVAGSAPGEVSERMQAKTGECFRVVFAGEPGVSAKFTWSSAAAHVGDGRAARLESPRGRALIAPGASALCLSAPGELALTLETRGSGRYAYQILKRR